ncbi:MAG: MATE family efflux transporter, partial [Natronospirillum sp.]
THQPQPPRTRNQLTLILTEWKTLGVLGGPILVAQLAQVANGVIDTVMAGNASAEDLAGVAIGSSLWSPLFLLFMGTLSAMQPIISGHHGAGRQDKIMPVTWQGIYIALGCSVLMIFLLLNVDPVLALLQMDGQTAAITRGYLQAFAFGVPALLVLMALRGLTDGLGHTRVIMTFSLLSAAINLPLNYIFIYGKLGVPAMGGVGCGWATAISVWLALLALLIYLGLSRVYQRFHLISNWHKPERSGINRLLRLGVPIGFTIFVEASMFAIIALFLVPLGPVVVAGHQIALNVVSLVFMVPLSLGMALTLRISFLVGAQTPDTAQRLARSSLLLCLGISLFFASLLWLGNAFIARTYTQDEAVRSVARQLLLFAALFQIADVVQVTAISALRGYRDTRIPMLIMLFSFWGICLPLGYLLTFTDLLVPAMGAPGFWIGLTAGLTVASILLALRLFLYRSSGVDPDAELAPV